MPNNETIYRETADTLTQRLRAGFDLISRKAGARGVTIRSAELADRSVIVSSCGLGSTTVAIAERVIDTLVQTGDLLKRG